MAEFTVCIIEDDLVSQFATRYRVEQAVKDCHIITFDDAESALKFFRNPSISNKDIPEIIFLDLTLGGMDGWDFLEAYVQIADWATSSRIYVLSSFGDSWDRAKVKTNRLIQGSFYKPLSKSAIEGILKSRPA